MGSIACPYCNQTILIEVSRTSQKRETYNLSSNEKQGSRGSSQGPLTLLSKEFYFDSLGVALIDNRPECISNYQPFPLLSIANQRKIVALVGSDYLEEIYRCLTEAGFIVIFANEQKNLSYDKLLVADATFLLNVSSITSDMEEKAAYVRSIGKQLWWLFATA